MHKKKFYGQHFLRDESVVDAIVEAAAIEESDNVLEIGPGAGVLTKELVLKAKKVLSVDIDQEAIDTTRKNVLSERLQLLNQDVLSLKNEDIKRIFNDEPFVLIGNVPYNITSKILEWSLGLDHKPERAIVMIQREVADRLLAGKGDMSLLGIVVQLAASVSLVAHVPRDAFSPPPKVESAVVRLDLYSTEDNHARGVKDRERLIRFAKVAFSQKRKQLKTTLGALPSVSVMQLEAALKKLGYIETARPEELSVGDWIALYNLTHENCR
ncbi:MAG TPA: 16S rRNA (adenine(1518)-N(6)/adenine(1519)-N(6))-dimethyltransferase RsmA [Patescibacteria group bacterium]|nr:16S rRNA (adenine(1518)-N(6)/adenine(1519)-N(6))-dimethyltransferase RsmA [Patescibacteria group bacterium]